MFNKRFLGLFMRFSAKNRLKLSTISPKSLIKGDFLMNSFRSNTIAALAAALTLFCAAPALADEATVKGIMGSVKVLSGRSKADPNNVNSWPDARLNMTLRAKDMIATLGEAEVRLETPDGSTVRLRENSVLEIASIKAGGDATLRLVDGSIVANAKKMAGGSKRQFEIQTPTSLAAIRGTTLEVDSRKNSGTTVKTFDGQVQVAPKGGKNFTDVNNYQMTEVAPGQKGAKSRAVPSFYKPKSTKLLS
jgi:hypothetical protein